MRRRAELWALGALARVLWRFPGADPLAERVELRRRWLLMAELLPPRLWRRDIEAAAIVAVFSAAVGLALALLVIELERREGRGTEETPGEVHGRPLVPGGAR